MRPAVTADLARLADIEVAADALLVDWLGADGWGPAPTGQDRALEPGFVLVSAVLTDDVAVGFVHVLEVGGLAHLEQLSVLPAYGRQGRGRALVDAAKAEVARRGHAVLTLRTYADVPWNAPFYARCGFVESTRETEFHRGLVDAETRLGLMRHGRRIQMVADLRTDLGPSPGPN